MSDTLRGLRKVLKRAWILPLTAVALAAAITPATTSAFTAKVAGTTNSAASNPYFTCAAVFTAYSTTATYLEYPLNDVSNSTYAVDDSATTARRGTYRGTMTTSTTTPLPCDDTTGGAYVLNGTSSYISTPTAIANPTTFTVAVWFNTTYAQGALIGFGNTATGAATQYDRLLYVNSAGRLTFGVYNDTIQSLTTPATYTDGAWHLAVATLSPTAGMTLAVDGTIVASNVSYTTPWNYTGYWRIGQMTLTGAPNPPTSEYFRGRLRYAAIYKTALSAAEIKAIYVAGA